MGLMCRACSGQDFESLVNLGIQPVANALASSRDEALDSLKYPLEVVVCTDCEFAQLTTDVAPSDVFNDSYVYATSNSGSFVEQSLLFAERVSSEFELAKPGKSLVEVASNDGYLLTEFSRRGVSCYGIEPSSSVASIAQAKGVETEVSFFGNSMALDLLSRRGPADFLVANNVLAHVPDPLDFARGVFDLLAEDGVATFEFPHLKGLIDFGRFDSIYHEHYSYLSLKALTRLFGQVGLRVFRVEHLESHGGSYRLFVDRVRRVPEESVWEALQAEGLASPLTSSLRRDLQKRAEASASKFRDKLLQKKAAGQVVVGASAPAKATTFLNFAKVDESLLPFVVDASPLKVAKWIPGVGIPVRDYFSLSEVKPDFVSVFAWNLESEIRSLANSHLEGDPKPKFFSPYSK